MPTARELLGLPKDDTGAPPPPPAPPVPPETAIGKGYREWVAAPLTKGVAALGSEIFRIPWSERATDPLPRAAGERVAKFIVPQTPTEALAAVGTAAVAGPLGPALGLAGHPARAAMARIAGGAIGGEAGNLLEGKQPGRGALMGGGGAAVGEAATAVGGKLVRSALARRVNRRQTAQVGEAIEQIVPQFKGTPMRTAADLEALARQPELGEQKLSRYLQKRIDQMKGQLPLDPETGQTLIEIPALPSRVRAATPTAPAGGVLGPEGVPEPPMPLNVRGWSPDDLVAEIQKLGNVGFGDTYIDPVGRTLDHKAARELWEMAKGQFERALKRLDPTGTALAAYRDGNKVYATGSAVLRLLRDGNAFAPVPNDTLLNFPGLQRFFGEHRAYYQTPSRMTPEEYNTLFRAIYHGGPIGSMDRVTRSVLPADAAAQMGRSGGGTGTLGVLAPRTLLPGIGFQYTGRPPYVAPDTLKVLADMAMQRAISQGVPVQIPTTR